MSKFDRTYHTVAKFHLSIHQTLLKSQIEIKILLQHPVSPVSTHMTFRSNLIHPSILAHQIGITCSINIIMLQMIIVIIVHTIINMFNIAGSFQFYIWIIGLISHRSNHRSNCKHFFYERIFLKFRLNLFYHLE